MNNVPPHSLVSRRQNVSSSMSDSVRRGALITTAFHIKDTVEYIELEYMVSPPGLGDAKMSKMKLGFSFIGDAYDPGNIDIWLNRPQRLRPMGSYKFGLGITEVAKGLDAYNDSSKVLFPKKEVLTHGDDWVELELDGDNLMGGVLEVTLLAKYPHCGILSIHLSASTYDDDPKNHEAKCKLTDDEIENFIKAAERMWRSRQKEILGGQTIEDYLEH